MVVAEANAVGTAYLRTSFLDDSAQTRTRNLLREYVEIRLAAASDQEQYLPARIRSEEIHGELWAIVEDTVSQRDESETIALFVEAVNEVIDVHTLRLTAVELRLPRLLGSLLYSAILLGFLLVGVANSANGKRDFVGMLLYALALVAVLMIVVDLDRAQQGLINVSQTALVDLLEQMTAAVQQ
jgi:hypothetical protein